MEARVEPIINLLHFIKQAGFCCGRSIINQTVFLTNNLEDRFEAKREEGAIDAVGHRGFTFKLLKLLRGKHTIRMTIKLV